MIWYPTLASAAAGCCRHERVQAVMTSLPDSQIDSRFRCKRAVDGEDWALQGSSEAGGLHSMAEVGLLSTRLRRSSHGRLGIVCVAHTKLKDTDLQQQASRTREGHR